MKHQVFYYEDAAEAAMTEILAHHRLEAHQRVATILKATKKTEGGCLVTPMERYSKAQFRGRQWPTYRIILCVLERCLRKSGRTLQGPAQVILEKH